MNLFWHRRDLRIPDNRALAMAARDGGVLPVFVVERDLVRQVGSRQRAFFYAGLAALRAAYRDRGADLLVRAGDPARVLAAVYDEFDADTVFYNRHYRPARRNRERRIDRRLPTRSATDLVLVDPADLADSYPHHAAFHDDWTAEPKPDPVETPPACAFVDPGVETPIPDADVDVERPPAGYEAARDRYDRFLADGIDTYAETRDDMRAAVERPVGAVSRLSPYIAAGMIGIREVWADAVERRAAADEATEPDVATFCEELSRRDQYYALLAHNPSIVTRNYVDFERRIVWRNDSGDFAAWQRGETGFPFVDAGMRQLDREGYVHARPRQVVASFLTKHLLVDWREGARYFAEHLLDHDPATNYGNWQWVASTGTDAVDVRIFDPVEQMRMHDPEAVYVSEHVPELADVPPEKVVAWPTLDPLERERLAPTYPDPIVDRDEAAERAERVFETALGKR